MSRAIRLVTGAAAGAALVALVAAPATAMPWTGKSVLLGAPTSGDTLYVDVSVTSNTPVVAYEYAYENKCAFPHRGGSSLQHDDIVTWTLDVSGVPHATVPVYLQSVPSGSSCKVYLVRNNTVIKGSTTSYTVS